MIETINICNKEKIEKIKKRSYADFDKVITRIKPVIKDVKTFGDKSLFKFTKLYDCCDITKNTIKVNENEIKEAYKRVGKETISAIKEAAANIKKYCEEQLPKEWSKEIKKGVKIGQLIRPLNKVGCYVPAGSFPLPSTVLMTVIPAKVAGVKEIIVCSPPKADNYAILVAADIAGADKIYRVGGAQAIAAMAYGTESIPKVDKIVGPGNIYVTAAKKLVYGDVGIDFLAGPSEILILAEKGNAEFIASDMIAQAEHDLLASAVLVTTDKKLAEDVKNELNKQLRELNKKSFAEESLRKYGAIVLVDNIKDGIEFSNDFAPEHLEIIVNDNSKSEILNKLKNFGALFIGEYSPEAAGDYATGPNHVLPTGGVARFRAGLSVMDFVKTPSVQELTKEGLMSLKETISSIASVEGLEGHRKSVEKRN